MKKLLLVLSTVALSTVASAAPVVLDCTVTSGTVLTAVSAATGYLIDNGVGNNTALGSGTISCPAVTASVGNVINSYMVLATIDYLGGPFGATSGTTVSQVLTLNGGSLNGAFVNGLISGGNSSSSVVPPVPFQIGSTLSGGTSYGAFTVNVMSSVSIGGPVSGSSGKVKVSYDQGPATPEPATYALFSAALVGFGLLRRRIATSK